MPAAAGIISLIGTGISAVSAYQQGQDQKAQARNNAILQSEQADQAQKTGVIQQNQYRRQLNQMLGRQRAIVAGNNLQNAGSPLSLQEDTAALGEEDIANIRNQAALSAWGYKVGAQQSLQQGDLYASAGNSKALGTAILGGAQYLRFSKGVGYG